MLVFAIRVVGHLLTDGMNPLRGRKVPACLHTKLDTTARKPEHAAHPAQMLKLRRTPEFPEIVCIERCTPICGIATNRLNTAGPFLNPDLEAAKADQRPALQALQAGIGQPETADRFHPGHRGPKRRRRPRMEGPQPARDRGRPGPRRVRTPSRTPGPCRAPAGRAGGQEPQVTRACTAPASDGRAA